jgi:catechol 2,3-dioxygenase-like lactoylglutathione lyase family enzyme
MPDFNVLQVTPFLHVPDLARTLDLFTRVLGFEVTFRLENYAYLQREGAAVRVLEERGRAQPEQGRARMTVYIDVRDVDALYAERLPQLRTLPQGDVQAPIDQIYNQREFHVRLPDGNWLAFGQAIARQGTAARRPE